MKLIINQEEITVEANASLELAVAAIGMTDAHGIAVAVNNKVVSKAKWAQFLLTENDKITVIHATQGG